MNIPDKIIPPQIKCEQDVIDILYRMDQSLERVCQTNDANQMYEYNILFEHLKTTKIKVHFPKDLIYLEHIVYFVSKNY
jgi:hypothetical protein